MRDNTIIEQTPEDKSPTTEGKNCFYDVLQRLDQVKAFAVYNQETNDEHLVSLEDGHFEVNGIQFKLHQDHIENLRLIYFRRNIIETNLDCQVLGYKYSINFGFQANDAQGANVKHIMTLA